MPDVEYINAEEGKKRVMNNAKLYAKLLTKFKADTNLEDLSAFAEAEEWDKARISAHTLKGIAANLSLTELFNQSLDIEAQIKNKAVKTESLEKIRTCFAETMVQVDKVIAEYA